MHVQFIYDVIKKIGKNTLTRQTVRVKLFSITTGDYAAAGLTRSKSWPRTEQCHKQSRTGWGDARTALQVPSYAEQRVHLLWQGFLLRRRCSAVSGSFTFILSQYGWGAERLLLCLLSYSYSNKLLLPGLNPRSRACVYSATPVSQFWWEQKSNTKPFFCRLLGVYISYNNLFLITWVGY